MEIISERSEIKDCQTVLTDSLEKNLTEHLPHLSGLPKKIKGQSREVADSAIHNGRLWFAFKDKHKHRYWNAFGLTTSYSKKEGYIIIAEINSPREGISDSPVGPFGVFAKDKDKKRYILHRGKFREYHQDISEDKSLHWWRNNYDSSELSELSDNQEAILISSLEDGSSLVKNITSFIKKVRDLKNHLHKFPDN